MRVQIPAYTDRWMMGDRYGEVVGTGRLRKRDVEGKLYYPSDNELGKSGDIYKVKLDKSGVVVKVLCDDCSGVE